MLVVEVQPAERPILQRNQPFQEILTENIKKKRKKQQETEVFQQVVERVDENYHQLQPQKEHLPKDVHAQPVEVLVAEKQEVNPHNLSIFSTIILF